MQNILPKLNSFMFIWGQINECVAELHVKTNCLPCHKTVNQSCRNVKRKNWTLPIREKGGIDFYAFKQNWIDTLVGYYTPVYHGHPSNSFPYFHASAQMHKEISRWRGFKNGNGAEKSDRHLSFLRAKKMRFICLTLRVIRRVCRLPWHALLSWSIMLH